MAAENLLNLMHCRDALRTGLPIPEHDEPLSAHAAMGFRVTACFLAEYLHPGLFYAEWGRSRALNRRYFGVIGVNIPPSRQQACTFGPDLAQHAGAVLLRTQPCGSCLSNKLELPFRAPGPAHFTSGKSPHDQESLDVQPSESRCILNVLAVFFSSRPTGIR